MTRKLAGGRDFADLVDEAWQVSAFRLALIALVAGSFAAGPVTLRWGLDGSWLGYLIPASLVCAAVGVVSTTIVGRPAWRNRRGSTFQLGEMLLIILAARLLVWAFVEGYPTPSEIPAWFLEPGRFFTGEFIFGAFVLLLAWSYALMMTSDFLDLAIQPDEVAARLSHEWGDTQSQWRAGRPVGRLELLQHFAVRWIGFGVVLVGCAAITRLEVMTSENRLVQVAIGDLGMRPEVVGCLVCYFVAGLLLMSHGRLAVLRGRWYNQEVDVRGSFIRRWHLNSLVFVGIIALLALVLPLGRTSWLTGIVEFVAALIARIVLAVWFAFGVLMTLLMSWLARVLGLQLAPETEQPAEPLPVLPSQEEMAAQIPPWVGSAVLWVVVLLVAAFLLVNFLRTTGIMESKVGQRLVRLRLWWRARRARISAAVAAQITSVRRRLRRVRRRTERPRGRAEVPLGPLLPRDQVRRYYLRALKEAGEEGVARPPHKTPLEFEEDLLAEWPETEGDIHELTEAFIDARYSTREIGDREVSSAESAWRRLLRGLRESRRDRP